MTCELTLKKLREEIVRILYEVYALGWKNADGGISDRADQILPLIEAQVKSAREEGFMEGVSKTTDACDSTFGAMLEAERERTHQETIDAVNDYTGNKISFERCAEIMDINYYELAAMCFKRCEFISGEEK